MLQSFHRKLVGYKNERISNTHEQTYIFGAVNTKAEKNLNV